MPQRRRTQKAGAKHPMKSVKYTPLRKQIVGFSKVLTRKKLMRPGTRKNKLNVKKFFPNIPILRHNAVASRKQFEDSIGAIKLLLKQYEKSPTLSDESQNTIFNFMIVLNEAIREKASKLEPELRVHFSEGTVEKITEESSTNSSEVEEQLKECISFFRKLKNRAVASKSKKGMKELDELIVEFSGAIEESVRSKVEGMEGKEGDEGLDDLMDAFGRL